MKTIRKITNICRNAEIILPSSKSVLNRALIAASIQNKKTFLTEITDICDDVKDLINVLIQLGIDINVTNNLKNKTQTIMIAGNNGTFDNAKNKTINCGLGGTTTRFVIGLSLLFDFDIKITSIGRMLKRPINGLVDAIKLFGKDVKYLKKENCLPIKISGETAKNIKKIDIDCSKSSQFLSAILLVADKIELEQIVAKNIVSKTYINITKDVLKKFGITVKISEKENYLICKISKKNKQKCFKKTVSIEIDWSSASYFLALEFLFKTKLKMNIKSQKSSQGDSKFLETLQKISDFKNKEKHASQYDVLEINMETMPDVSMTAMVVCAFQNFTTNITGLGTLKNKECNRLKAMHDEFKKIGIKTEISKEYDAIKIHGNANLSLQNDIEIETYNDHRIAMCFAIVGAKTGHIIIKNPNVVSKSFPTFWQEFEKCYM